MSNASLEKELKIITENTTGIAGKLTSLIANEANVNIKALWGGVLNGKGNFSIITDNNANVATTLKNSEFNNLQEGELLVVRVPNKIGSCANIASTIGSAGIDINFLFTTIFDNEPAVVLSTKNNQKALGLLS